MSAVDRKQEVARRVPADTVCPSPVLSARVRQFMNCVYPSAPVTITSIQILMASAEGATM